MTLKDSKDINVENEDALPVKIFSKSSYQERKEEIKDNLREDDDSDMKIFIMKKSRLVGKNR